MPRYHYGIRNTTGSHVEEGRKPVLFPGCLSQLFHFLLFIYTSPLLTHLTGGLYPHVIGLLGLGPQPSNTFLP